MALITTITPGDQVTDMSDHKPTWKSFLDWEVYSPFEITQSTFDAVRSSIKGLRHEPIMNKMAYAISSTTDTGGDVSSILIMYRHDRTFHMAMLFSPKWKYLI